MIASLILSALIIIGTWLDVASTLYAGRHYKLFEANWFSKPLVPHPALFYIVQTAFWGGLIAWFFTVQASLDWYIAFCIIRFGAVAWNVNQIRIARDNALKPQG
jgi:hypothetical protein